MYELPYPESKHLDEHLRAAHAVGRASRDAEVEALRADAERLDWLLSAQSDAHAAPESQRDLILKVWDCVLHCEDNYTRAQTIEAIDAAITAARAAQEK